MISGIIFDLDGVICHTDEYHYLAWKALADRLGIFFDRTVNEQLRGISRMQSLDIVLQQDKRTYTEEEKQALAAEKNGTYVKMLEKMSPADLAQETRETLKCLRSRGYRLAVGSSSKNAPFILERLGLGDFFDAVSHGGLIHNSKPDPEVFLLAARMIGMQPRDCLVVEDAEQGLLAARRGGMRAAAIGSAVESDLADYRLSRFADLKDICGPIR